MFGTVRHNEQEMKTTTLLGDIEHTSTMMSLRDVLTFAHLE